MNRIKYILFSISCFLLLISYSQENSTALTYYKKAHIFKKKHQIDSAHIYYKKAKKEYLSINDSIFLGDILLNISGINSKHKNYIGSENNIIEALKIFTKLDDTLKISLCYSKLGIISKDQQRFKKAIEYHKKALLLRKKFKKKLQIASLTNLGVTYKEKKDYKTAITYFTKAIKYKNINEYPEKQARLLDYIGYCNFKLGDFKNLPKQFILAKDIQKKINHKQGIVTSNLHLAEYYINLNKYKNANTALEEAILVAKKIKNNDGILTALKFLAITNPKNATHYFNVYTKLNDSINKQQLLQKEQFSRVKFETKEKKDKIELQKTALQTKNYQQKLLIIILAISLLSLLIFGFFYKKIKIKNEQIINLQKEIHHRVTNNLAMINRFISISKKKTSNKKALENYNTLSNRIKTIKSIHELLYRNKSVGVIDLQKFITKICNLTSIAYKQDKDIIVYINAKIFIDSKISEPLGLMLNELITNSYKYAFANRKNGEININCCFKDKNILLSFSDNGIGFPKNFEITKTKSYGLKLLNGLTKQLNGKIKVTNTKKGSNITIIIPT